MARIQPSCAAASDCRDVRSQPHVDSIRAIRNIESCFPRCSYLCFFAMPEMRDTLRTTATHPAERFLLWFPSPIGIFRQGRRWGLICAAPVAETEFTDPKNAADLRRLLGRLLRVKMLLGVNQLSLAGILPTALRRSWSPSATDAAQRAPEVVRRAVHIIRREHFTDRNHNVVLLGGAGRIGRKVYESLKADGIDVVVIDSALPTTAAFKDLGAVSMILVDVSRHGVIQRHINELPEGTVVLNEVFPEPSRDVVKQLKGRNIAAYHIAGVKAEVYPSLPHGYRNALPCCAIHSDEIGELVLTRIA